MNSTSARTSAELLAAAVTQINQGAYEAAEASLRLVLVDHPRHPVAVYLLGVAAFERENFADSERLLRQALALSPNQPRVVLQLARTLLAQHRVDDAELQLRAALKEVSQDLMMRAQLEHQLGQVLKLQQKYQEALAAMEAAGPYLPPGREPVLERANVLRHLGRGEEAVALYDAILAANPLDLAVHTLRSELLGSAHQDFVASYDLAQMRAPHAPELAVAKGHLLLKAKQPDRAVDAFRHALKLSPELPAALVGLGRALEGVSDKDGARAAYARSVAVAAEDDNSLLAYAEFLLRQRDVKLAGPLAEKAWRLQPASQSVLSVLDLCWRAQGDGRADWLVDYNRDVVAFDLEPPEGYPDMEAYNRELETYLNSLHTKAREYLTQTLRGGTQTHDDLFYNGHPLVDSLLPRFSEAIQSYVARWRPDPQHPFNARRGRGFRYGGSWSARLSDSGFHENHIHHKGWISSCYYVAVPEVARSAPPQGAIKFGQPPAGFGMVEEPRLVIQPKPGRLVLFPSYMWHGTVPFRSPQTRVTIAFDAIPA